MIQILLSLLFLSCKLVSIDRDCHEGIIFSDRDQREKSFSDGFYVGTKPSSYPDSFRSPCSFDQAIQLAIMQKLVQMPKFCAQRYNLSVEQVSELLQADPADIVEKLLQLDHVTDLGIMELWHVYKHSPWHDKKQRKQYRKQAGNIENELKRSLSLRAA